MKQYIKISEVENQLNELAEQLTAEPIIITKDEKPVIIAFNIEQFNSLLETLEIRSDQKLMSDIKTGIKQVENQETISLHEIES
jgi:PHD/YefM family antitoxin component YafN of YafNO toxin-antitoxin module